MAAPGTLTHVLATASDLAAAVDTHAQLVADQAATPPPPPAEPKPGD
jgi:hypothetical protein